MEEHNSDAKTIHLNSVAIPYPYLSQLIFSTVMECYSSPIYRYLALSLLGYICYHNVHVKRDGIDKWFALPMSFWDRVLGRNNSRKLIKSLRENNILEFDDHYIIGRTSKRCRLEKRFRTNESDFGFYEDIKSVLIGIKTKKMRPHRDFRECLAREIDKNREKLPPEIKDQEKKYKKRIGLVKFTEGIEEIARINLMNAQRREAIRVEKLIKELQSPRKYILTKCDAKSGRQYNSITFMPQWLRRELIIDGERLVEIDMKQAQPTLLGGLYRDCSIHDKIERDLYFDFLRQENIYEYFNARVSKPIKKERVNYKEVIKRQFIIPLFGRNHMVGTDSLKLFAAKFPILFTRIMELKRVDYKEISIYLQKIEADIFVNDVFEKCFSENIWATTIHDCLLCKASDAERVAKEIKRAVFEKIGTTPILKLKDHNGDESIITSFDLED